MRNYLLNIGGMVAGAVVITAVSAGLQRNINAAPELVDTTVPEEVAPPANIQPPATPELITSPGYVEPPTYVYEPDQEFSLINAHSQYMFYFYASPSDASDWENDILGDSVLGPGESVSININDNRQTCLYDFRAILEDGSEFSEFEVNICQLASYTFN